MPKKKTEAKKESGGEEKEDVKEIGEEAPEYFIFKYPDGTEERRKVIFSVIDEELNIGFIYIETDDPECVECFKVNLDKDKNPIDETLTPVGEDSENHDLVVRYLELYTEGKLMTLEEARAEDAYLRKKDPMNKKKKKK